MYNSLLQIMVISKGTITPLQTSNTFDMSLEGDLVLETQVLAIKEAELIQSEWADLMELSSVGGKQRLQLI